MDSESIVDSLKRERIHSEFERVIMNSANESDSEFAKKIVNLK